MQLFILNNPEVGENAAATDFTYCDGTAMGAAPRCPVCNHAIGLMPLVPPIKLEIKSWGFTWGDIAFYAGTQILVSEKLKSLFLVSGLDGITRFDPVEIVKAKRRKSTESNFPTYYLASIKISRAAIDAIASGLVRGEGLVCNECRLGGIIKRLEKIVLEPKLLPAEDIFVPRGLPGRILVSERFKHLCEKNNLLNCSFIPVEQFSFDFYPNED